MNQMKPIKVEVSYERTIMQEPYKPERFSAHVTFDINQEGQDPVSLKEASALAFAEVYKVISETIYKYAPAALSFEDLESVRKGFPKSSEVTKVTDL